MEKFIFGLFSTSELVEGKRIVELDSLRGIAALAVLFNHSVMVYPFVYQMVMSHDVHNAPFLAKILMFSPLHSLWSGHSAVILFFVLSGFVLSVAYYKEGRDPSYRSYIIKRICRLYIPCFVLITISACLMNVISREPRPEFSEWFKGLWYGTVSLSTYVRYLFLQGSMHHLGTALWTIVIEIELSFILPFFFKIMRKATVWQNVLLILFCILCSKAINRSQLIAIIPDLKNLYYLPFFLLGSLLYKHRLLITQANIKPAAIGMILLPVALLLYNWEWMLPWVVKYNSGSFLYSNNDYIIGAGSAILIVICLAGNPLTKRIMGHRFSVFLGDISYCLYLVHITIILLLINLFKPVSYNYLVMLVPPLGVAIGYVYYLLVDKPSTALGRSLSKKVDKWLESRKEAIA